MTGTPELPGAPIRALALDTSSEHASVALSIDGVVVASLQACLSHRHGRQLLSMVESALALGGLSKSDLSAVFAGVGPGSFTGTRVGVATAKGLSLALGVPLLGVSSLRALAVGAPPQIAVSKPVLVAALIDAHKGEVYGALYTRDGAELGEIVEPFHAQPADAAARIAEHANAPVLACGTGALKYQSIFAGASTLKGPILEAAGDYHHPRAEHLLTLGLDKLASGAADELLSIEPQYVRASDAVKPSLS